MIEVFAESSISLFSHKGRIFSTEIFDNLTCSISAVHVFRIVCPLCLGVLMNMPFSAKIGILKTVEQRLQFFHIGKVRGLL